MQDTPQEAMIGDKAARELLEVKKLKAVNAIMFNALEQVSMHASVSFTDDNAVMASWIRCVDGVNSAIKECEAL